MREFITQYISTVDANTSFVNIAVIGTVWYLIILVLMKRK